jgi:hypothetical protein
MRERANDFYQTIHELCYCTESLFELINPLRNEITQCLKQGPSKKRSIVTEKEEIVRQIEASVKSRLEKILQSGLPVVQIHTGGKNQELLRKEGAVALATNRDIYIREEAYQEGSAETDAILLHEMTHILQMERHEQLHTQAEIAEAEYEANQAELLAYPLYKNYYYAEIEGKLFCMNKQSEKQAVDYAVTLTNEMIQEAVSKNDVKLLAKIQHTLECTI